MNTRTRRRVVAVLAALVALGAVVGCSDDRSGASTVVVPTTSSSATSSESTATVTPPTPLAITVVSSSPHDPAAFTEGLLFTAEDRLFESLGLEGKSSVREVDPETGAVLQERGLDAAQFGEGLAEGSDGLVQLTWQSGVAHRWSLDGPAGNDLVEGDELSFDGEGWGLTFDGTHFVQSDGSSTLTFRDPTTFAPVSELEVRRAGAAVDELNELEWVDGVIYANVWHSDEILRIDPDSGVVTGVIDASGLWRDPARTSEMTLNGIAHRPGDPPTRLHVTGKNWPQMFLVDVTGE